MQGAGTASLLKEGTKHLSGVEEAVLGNIHACQELTQVTRTSLGPNGMNKMVINHLNKLFVTNDAVTIMKELDVIHPAAKLIVLACQMQEAEVGDGTNLVVVLAGELLSQAESLITSGLPTTNIISGYSKALERALELLEEWGDHTCKDVTDVAEVTKHLKTVVSSKQYGYEEFLTPMIAQACIQILPRSATSFNVDNVRVCKVVGGGILDTTVIKGFAITGDSTSIVKHVSNAKVAVFAAGIDVSKTETKGTVLLQTAEQLLSYTKGEEKDMEEVIKKIVDSGANVLVAGGPIGELAKHFIDKYKLFSIKVQSKFDLRRICSATGARPLVRLGAPTAEELGSCESVSVDEVGSTKVAVFRSKSSRVSTLILRGSTSNILDDIERCVDDGVNAFKAMIKENRFLPGGGATEIKLASELQKYGEQAPGLHQYAIKKYGEALEVVPRTLAETSGLEPIHFLSNLYAEHQRGESRAGIDIKTGGIKDAYELGLFDLLITKRSALRLATEVAVTVLRIDQIIKAKRAGGPSLPSQRPR